MNRSESAAHLELKRLALSWAREHGFPIVATEVSLPNLRFRLDVAAYQPQRTQIQVFDARRNKMRKDWAPSIGVTAVFECKASRADYRRDANSVSVLTDRLDALHKRKDRIEEELRLFYPSIRNGDSLFQEYETLDYTRPGHELYQRTLKEISRHAIRLHVNTKFEKLLNWGAANLFYVVAEPGILSASELPPGWGLLVRNGPELCVQTKPVLHELEEAARLALLHRIALSGARTAEKALRPAAD